MLQGMSLSSWHIDCHVHSSCYSPCSRLRPEQACRLASERGLEAIVFTEHQIQWPQADLRILRNRHPGLAIYSGLELSLAEGFDIVCLLPEIDLQLPYGLSLNALEHALAPFGDEVFCFVAHPFRFLDRWDPDLDRMAPFLHGVEMNSVNILRGQACWEGDRLLPCRHELYRQLADTGLVQMFNSDAHLAEAIGTVSTRISLAHQDIPADTGELAALFRQHPRTYEHQNTNSLWPLVAGTAGI